MKNLILCFALLLGFYLGFGQAPTITSFSPDSGAVGTLVTIIGTNLSTPTTCTIGGVAAIVVSGSADTLVGMVMPGAGTGVVSVTTAGGTATGSSFTMIQTPFPHVQEGYKLANDTGYWSSAAYQGNSVSLSADGNTAIVGAPGLYNTYIGALGGALIYTRSGGTWIQQGPVLIGSGYVNGTYQSGVYQGQSVSLSSDGNTAILGGPGDNNDTGAAWVFTRSGGTWTQQGPKLVGTGAVGTGGSIGQGSSVSLSADGNTAIVGGNADDSGAGAAWVYIRSGGVWTQQGFKLVGAGAVGRAGQGRSVFLSADGNTAIVGGNTDSSSIGAVWVFTRSGGIWTQQGPKLVGSGATQAPPSGQGNSVSLSADGNTAIVGGPGDNVVGAIWVFTRSGGAWTQQGSKLVGTGNASIPEHGFSVSLSADGNTAIAGGPGDGNNSDTGATWVFTRSGGTWMQRGQKLLGTGSVGQAQQGISVSLSADGSTAIVGGSYDNNNVGAAWVFVPCSPISSSIAISICQGATYTLGSQNLLASGTYFDTLTSVGGCDSFITLTLTVNSFISTNIAQNICQGGNYYFNGQNLSLAGTYIDTLTSVFGCDSIITLSLAVNPNSGSSISENICQGSAYAFGANNLSASGTYFDTLTAANGCDSIITLTLTVNPNSGSGLSQSICQGDTYHFAGQNLSTPGAYFDTLTAANGCDSIITLTLTVNPNSGSGLSQSICQGDTYHFAGQNLSTPGTYFDTLTSAIGCDSIVTLTLTVNSNSGSSL